RRSFRREAVVAVVALDERAEEVPGLIPRRALVPHCEIRQARERQQEQYDRRQRAPRAEQEVVRRVVQRPGSIGAARRPCKRLTAARGARAPASSVLAAAGPAWGPPFARARGPPHCPP